MRKLALSFALLAITQSADARGWRLRDLDPFNRQGGLREGLARNDPFAGLGHMGGRAINRMAHMVAQSETFRSKADSDGWNLNNCRTAGVGIGAAVIGFKSTPLCASLIPEPVTATTCVALLTGSAGTIVHIACTQLCNDHKLRDC